MGLGLYAGVPGPRSFDILGLGDWQALNLVIFLGTLTVRVELSLHLAVHSATVSIPGDTGYVSNSTMKSVSDSSASYHEVATKVGRSFYSKKVVSLSIVTWCFSESINFSTGILLRLGFTLSTVKHRTGYCMK